MFNSPLSRRFSVREVLNPSTLGPELLHLNNKKVDVTCHRENKTKLNSFSNAILL